jgi:hypothetical protein
MTERDVYVDAERMYRLFETSDGKLGIAVMSGGIGAFEVKMILDGEELSSYGAEGRPFLERLAWKIAKDPLRFDARTYG